MEEGSRAHQDLNLELEESIKDSQEPCDLFATPQVI
jgi:hypothetical protein